MIEALVATIILAGGITAITGLSSRCLVRTRLNQQYDRAWQLLDRQLTLIDAMGINQFLEQRTSLGEIEDGDITFQWEVGVASQEIDQLYLVTMSIRWFRGRQWHTITAATCLNGQDVESVESGR
ncbi:MAG: hypothetical protein AMJ79_06155 [Phycisphaerae bacterium SM23_30]|nr:MAG: hypothetical protein AMJ79_06155 [Phycisphaerae bacterium SM23_30]